MKCQLGFGEQGSECYYNLFFKKIQKSIRIYFGFKILKKLRTKEELAKEQIGMTPYWVVGKVMMGFFLCKNAK